MISPPGSPRPADAAMGLSVSYVQICFQLGDFLSFSEIKLKYLSVWLGTCHESQKGQKRRLLYAPCHAALTCRRFHPPAFASKYLSSNPCSKRRLLTVIFLSPPPGVLALRKQYSKLGFGIILRLVMSPFCFSSRCGAELIPGTLGQRQSSHSADMCNSLSRAVCEGNPC